MAHIDKDVNVVGTCCPVPLIRVSESLKFMQPGQVLRITGDDPVFECAIRDFCQAHGYAILDMRRVGHETVLTIRL